MLVTAGVVGVLNYGLLVLASLFSQFNLPTLMINAFYLGVSIWGLSKCSLKNSTS